MPEITPTVGLPYARVRVEGTTLIRQCPTCGEEFAEETDRYGEQTTDRYAAHWLSTHNWVRIREEN